MAATKVKSLLAGKYGAKLDGAVKQHANDDTNFGVVNIPGGITGGIAQISKCYFKEFDAKSSMKKADGSSAKGEFFFRAEGVVISPETVKTDNGIIPVKGLTTSVMIPLCDVKRGDEVQTQDDAIQRILNEMRKLGGQEYTKGATGADLESLAAGLEEAAPYFRFSTVENVVKNKDGGTRVFVNEYWNGSKGLENYRVEEVFSFNETPAPAKQDKVTQPQVPEKRVEPESRDDGIIPVDDMSVEDLVSLAGSEADTAGDARQKLVDLAIAAGYTEEEVTSEEVGWEDVAKMIENPKGAEEAVEEVKTKEPPKKGETCMYAPPSKKNPGTYQTARECKVTAVDAKAKTADLTDLTNKVVYKSVEWHNCE